MTTTQRSWIQRLATLARYLERLRDRWALARDLRAFRRNCGFLREARALESGSGRVLIVSLSNWIAQVKCEIMLATALRLRGWTPVVLTRSGASAAHAYFRAAGIDQLIKIESIQAPPGPAGQTDRLLDGRTTFRALLEAADGRVAVGRHVLSTVVRAQLQGRLDVADAGTRQLIRERAAESLRAIAAGRAVLEQVRPDLLLFLEKGYTPYGELFDLALEAGIPAIQWSHGHRQDALIFKRYAAGNRDLHPFSVSPETWAEVRRAVWSAADGRRIREEFAVQYQRGTWFSRKFHHRRKTVKDADTVRRQLGLDPAKKTAVIFSHVLWDATFFYGTNIFDDYEEWLIETVRAACANSAVNWVIKIHPDYVWKLKLMGGGTVRDRLALAAQVGPLPGHIRVMEPDTDVSTFSLFDVMDYCLTVRGTIGIEAPCFGIPVITAGTGRYSGLGFTIDADSREAYRAMLMRIQDIPRLDEERTALAQRHAYALLRLRPCPFTTFEMVQDSLERLGHPLDHNVIIRARSLRDLQQAEDLGLFADWVDQSRDEDFLMSMPAPAAEVPAALSSDDS